MAPTRTDRERQDGRWTWLIPAGLGLAFLILAPRTGRCVSRFDEPKALEGVARVLFEVGRTQPVTVRLKTEIERYGEGFLYQTYEVRGKDDTGLGEFTRVQVFLGPGAQIDLGVALEEDRIKRVEPVRPLFLGGEKFTRLGEILDSLKHRPVDKYATGMARFFNGLHYLIEAEEGPWEPPPLKPGEERQVLMTVTQPAIELGDAMPRFEARDLDGKAISPEVFMGHPTVIILGSVLQEKSMYLFRAAEPLLSRWPRIWRVAIVKNRSRDVRKAIEEGATLGKTVLADQVGTLHGTFKVTISPYLYLFDASGKLVYKTFWKGGTDLETEISDAVKKLKIEE